MALKDAFSQGEEVLRALGLSRDPPLCSSEHCWRSVCSQAGWSEHRVWHGRWLRSRWRLERLAPTLKISLPWSVSTSAGPRTHTHRSLRKNPKLSAERMSPFRDLVFPSLFHDFSPPPQPCPPSNLTSSTQDTQDTAFTLSLSCNFSPYLCLTCPHPSVPNRLHLPQEAIHSCPPPAAYETELAALSASSPHHITIPHCNCLCVYLSV